MHENDTPERKPQKELEHGHDAEGSTERRRVCRRGNRIH